MRTSFSSLTQSKYFTPAFNSAIFDGPVRIYFAQFHESFALKVYFMLQEKYAQQMARAKELSKKMDGNIMVMLYPTAENFSYSFEQIKNSVVATEAFGDDMVIGLKGPLEDGNLIFVLEQIEKIIDVWEEKVKTQSAFAEPAIEAGL